MQFLRYFTDIVPGSRARANLRQQIQANARVDTRFVVMNLLSAIVATYGLLADSTATVIGAMVIATLLDAISGIALALVDGNSKLLRQALLATLCGVVIILAVSISVGWLHRWMPISSEALARAHPTVLDLAIAFAGGAAGAFATVSPRVSAGVVGVAIATALVPPLAVSGICISHGKWRLALGAFELFLTNFAAIQVTNSMMMWMFGFRGLANRSWWQILLRNRFSLTVLLILSTVLSLNLFRTASKYQTETTIRKEVATAIEQVRGAELLQLTFEYPSPRQLQATVVVVTPQQIDQRVVESVRENLSPLKHVEIDMKFLSLLSSSLAQPPEVTEDSKEE